MADRDFWEGLRLVSYGLVAAAKKASYSVGCGAGGLGLAIWGVGVLGINGPASLLIPMSAFFLLARLGRILDERAERRDIEDTLEEFLLLQERLGEQQLKLMEAQSQSMAQLVSNQTEYLRIQSEKTLMELKEKIDRRTDT